MDGYGISTYGDLSAAHYDEWHDSSRGDKAGASDPVSGVLAELAVNGRALELAIGTGRVALPLAARGVEVHGIDSSQAMVDRLRAKPGGAAIPVTLGDFADVEADGEFGVVFVVFNTLFALATQADQVRCFRNVAAALAPGGTFVVEVFVPDLTRYASGQSVRVSSVRVDRVVLDVGVHDPVAQRIDVQQVVLASGGSGGEPADLRMTPVSLRYAWPAELDLMAQLAGLRLRDRWADWGREPFTAASRSHVSVYERE